MQLDYKASVTLIAGVSGTGKSTFAVRYLLNVPACCRFIFDPEGEMEEILRARPAGKVEELEAAVPTGWVIFDPHVLFPGQMDAALRFFCEWSFSVCERGEGRKILFIDEVWKYCNPRSIPQELAICVQTGRKRGMELVFCAQRPNLLNESLTNETTELVTFRVQGKNALDLIDFLGGNVEVAANLPDFHFHSINLRNGVALAGSLPR